MFSCLLLVHGLARSQVGVDSSGAVPTAEDHDEVPAGITDGGPVLDARGANPVSARMPAKTIALTFDDGPDPVWTPKVLDSAAAAPRARRLLRHRHDGRAAPRTAARTSAQRPEVGLHTFTHPDLSDRPGPAHRPRALADPAGARTGPLGESTPAAPAVLLLRRRAGQRRPAVVPDRRPRRLHHGAQRHRQRGLEAPRRRRHRRQRDPASGAGGVVLLHDAGGDRSQTVAALDR